MFLHFFLREANVKIKAINWFSVGGRDGLDESGDVIQSYMRIMNNHKAVIWIVQTQTPHFFTQVGSMHGLSKLSITQNWTLELLHLQHFSPRLRYYA